MDEYIPRGKPSYPLSLDKHKAAATLSTALSKPLIEKLINTLNITTDTYLVGGAVRDAILGIPSRDIDLALGLPPEQVIEILQHKNFRVIETGIEHGTITVLVDDGEGIEITTFRTPSARDNTEFGNSIEEDLSGRDLTINAIAFHCNSMNFIDPFDGVNDLINGVCKAVGDAEIRFTEDPLRILRFVRFGVAAGRTSDSHTLSAAKKLANSINQVSIERIRNEFINILVSHFVGDALKQLHYLGLIELIIPELVPTIGCEQNEFHIHDVFDHTAWVLDRSIPDPIVRTAALLHDIGKPLTVTTDESGRRHFYNHEKVGAEITTPILERLKFSTQDTRRITRLVKEHMRPLECGPSGVRRIMRDMAEDFDLWLAMKRADAPPIFTLEQFKEVYEKFIEMVEEEYEKNKLPSYGVLAVNGDDILGLGVKAGPEVGRILKELEEIVIQDPEKNIKEDLLKMAIKFIKN